MKITKRQLKRIIKEEKRRLVEQSALSRDAAQISAWLKAASMLAGDAGMSATAQAIYRALDALESEVPEFDKDAARSAGVQIFGARG